MAEALASAVIEFVVEKLLSRAFNEIEFTKDVNSHIENIKNTKITIDALFLDADKLQSLSHAQRLFLERLRCPVDKVDDLLDAKAARAKMQRDMGGSRIGKEVTLFFSSSSNPIISAFRYARKVKAIRKELDSVVRDHAEFGNTLSMFSSTMNQTSQAPKLETGSYIIKEEVIGRDQDRNNIINMLFGSYSNGVREPLCVISIVGIGGIGKSTLAKYVYNDGKVQMYFDLKLWVCATQDFNIKEMLHKILASASNEKPIHSEMDQLEHCLLNKISGKKYLLVLDNVWDNHSFSVNWEELRKLLLSGAPGSRILITSRTESIARRVGMNSDPYTLMDLATEDSWILFQRVAFRHWQEPGVEAIGKEIAKMCPNVPLVICTIGGFLAEKCTVKEWRAFRDDKFTSLSLYGCSIVQTLKLSYDQLDPCLKLCFAYCSLFPQGYQFPKHKLVCELIALGYVQKEYKNQSLMDAGEVCVLNLLKRGLFHDLRKDLYHRNDESCRMHDLIHDLAVSIAGFEFKMVRSNSDEIDERVRHVSFVREADICWDSLSKVRHLRSFLIVENRITRPKLTKLLRSFPYLRVLSLQKVGMKEVPTSIGKLIHLRHLDLSWNVFCELPKSVKRLVYLLTLDLSRCQRLKQLPWEIGELSNLLSLDLTGCKSLENLPGEVSKLVKLRHLRLFYCLRLRQMPIGLGNLTNLQRLDWFVAEQPSPSDVGSGLSELSTLNNLEGDLTIIFRGHQCESTVANLQMKEKLMALHLSFNSLEENHKEVLEGLKPHADLRRLRISYYNGKSLPSWMMKNQLHCSLPNLVEIQIEGADCELIHLCYFGRLPHLQCLALKELKGVEYIEEDEDAAPVNGEAISEVAPLFPSLEILTLSQMPKLKGCRRGSRNTNESARPPSLPRLKRLNVWEVGFEVFADEFRGLSSLQTLNIQCCEQLKEIPEWIDDFISLITLDIRNCLKLMPLPKQIGNLPNLESIIIARCRGAFAKWWEDPTLPDCPIKQLPPENDKEWKWQYSSHDDFHCYKYRKA